MNIFLETERTLLGTELGSNSTLLNKGRRDTTDIEVLVLRLGMALKLISSTAVIPAIRGWAEIALHMFPVMRRTLIHSDTAAAPWNFANKVPCFWIRPQVVRGYLNSIPDVCFLQMFRDVPSIADGFCAVGERADTYRVRLGSYGCAVDISSV